MNKQDNEGYTPLMDATEAGKLTTVELLVRNGADVNLHNSFNVGSLHMAIDLEDISTTRLLLENGADINGGNGDGDTPLHTACRRANDILVKILLDRGADHNIANKKGSTPLHLTAVRSYRDRALDMLVTTGADVNARDGKGKTPLHLVCCWSDKETSKAILGPLTMTSLSDQAAAGHAPQNTVEDARSADVVKTLLDHRADAQAKDESGKIPLEVIYEREDIGSESDPTGSKELDDETNSEWEDESDAAA